MSDEEVLEYRVSQLEKQNMELRDDIKELTSTTKDLVVSVKLLCQQFGFIRWVVGVCAATVIAQIVRSIV